MTLGVHARRSRGLLQEAVGGGVRVGVIALPDPECPAGAWWLKGTGRVKVVKELVALMRG